VIVDDNLRGFLGDILVMALRTDARLQSTQLGREVAVTLHPAEGLPGCQQPDDRPPKCHSAMLPAFHVPTDPLECPPEIFDGVGGGPGPRLRAASPVFATRSRSRRQVTRCDEYNPSRRRIRHDLAGFLGALHLPQEGQVVLGREPPPLRLRVLGRVGAP